MANLNSVVLVGRVSRDPKLEYESDGFPVCSFQLLCKQRPIEVGDDEKTVEMVHVEVKTRKRLAEICQEFLKEGREVLVMGSLSQSGKGLMVWGQQVQFLFSLEDKEEVK